MAGNLRSPITAVGPVIDEIKAALAMTNTQAGLLTSIPLLTWAAFSGLIGNFSVRYKIEKVILVSILLLIAGLYFRLFDNINLLFLGSAIMGFAICIANVLMPAFVKKNFPTQLGLMTGVYTVAMNLTAAFASGYSIKMAQNSSWGWKTSLGIWILPTVFTLFIWLTQLKNKREMPVKKPKNDPGYVEIPRIYHSRLAWDISIYTGLQSMMYYVFAAWIPKVMMDYGMDRELAGWVVSWFLLATLPITFVGPIIANKMKNQKPMMWLLWILLMASLILIFLFKMKYIYLAAVLFGIANGFSFSLAMLLFSLRTKSSLVTVKISGMAQSVGYFIAALGPIFFGKIFDITGNWDYSFYFLIANCALILYFGLRSSAAVFIEDDLEKKMG